MSFSCQSLYDTNLVSTNSNRKEGKQEETTID